MEVNNFETNSDNLINWLDIIKLYIKIGNSYEIERSVKHLKKYNETPEISLIIKYINTAEYNLAFKEIQTFQALKRSLILADDIEMAALLLEIKELENLVQQKTLELDEAQKLVDDYQYYHSIYLGELILELLELKKNSFRNDKNKYNQAFENERKYKSTYKKETNKVKFEISKDEKVSLKKRFRKASTLCHPDKFVNEPESIQKKAKEIFQKLNAAYKSNDLFTVTEILNQLEKGFLNVDIKHSSGKKDLKDAISILRTKLADINKELLLFTSSETYKAISEIEDWDLHFSELKIKLKLEIEEFKTGGNKP